MKKLASIGLLVLLLYNTFGLSFAVLLFDKDFEIATNETGDRRLIKIFTPQLPYSDSVQLQDPVPGLIRHEGDFYNAVDVLHANDTLYVTLQTNAQARERFQELSGAMQVLGKTPSESAKSPYSKAIQQLSILLKLYIPADQNFKLDFASFSSPNERIYRFKQEIKNCRSGEYQLATPPPERC